MKGNSEYSGVALCASMYKVIFIPLNNRHAKAKYTCLNLLDMRPGSEVTKNILNLADYDIYPAHKC